LSLITAILVVGLIFASGASASWTNLGGDPLFPGGIQGSGQAARNDFVRKITSARADIAMQRMGLSLAERRAVRRAATTGRFRRCTMHYGDTFQRMSYGAGAIFVDVNVTFADPDYRAGGAAAFCMDVPVGKVVLHLLTPFKCVNFALKERTKMPPPQKPPKVPVTVRKDAKGGSGTFTIQWRAGHGKWKTKRVKSGKRYTLTHVLHNTCTWVREPKVPSGWKRLSAPLIRKCASGRSLNFVVVNQKVKQPKPTPQPPTPPKCSANQIEKVNESGQIVCSTIEQGGICTSNNVQVGGGNTNNTYIDCSTRIETPPPPPEKPRVCPPGSRNPVPPCNETPPEKQVSAQCTSLRVENSLIENLLVNATVTYQATNATLREIAYHWGDSSPPTITSSLTASHRYARAGTYTIYAVLTFDTWDGGTTSATCADRTVTPKDGTTGQGTGTPGPGGGPGSGGTPERPGTTGEVCTLPDGSVGYKDQFGICNPTT